MAAAPVPLPIMPAAPANLSAAALPLPAAPASAIPTPMESVVIKTYALTLGQLRVFVPNAVTPVELAAWGVYSSQIEEAAAVPGVAAAFAAAIAPLDAKITNLMIMKSNNRVIELSAAGAPNSVNPPLAPLVKEAAGVGAGIGGGGGGAALPAGHPIAVGTAMPSPPFPADLATLNGLTAANINTLSIAYNNTFGIVAGDVLAVKRQKFAKWIQGFV